MTEAYDLRSNIKGKPGSQGTLFQVQDKSLLNPAQRWPKGYTPERQAEISGALRNAEIQSTTRTYPPQSDSHVRARLVDTIARSTVPAEDLHGLSRIHDQPAPGHDASYWPAIRTMGVHMFKPVSGDVDFADLPKKVEPNTEGEKNLIHELGHHHDQVNRVTVGLVNNDKDLLYTPGARDDAAEAVADNYYVEHARGRGRAGERPTQGRYEESGGAQYMPAYRKIRPAPQHMGPQFQQGELW